MFVSKWFRVDTDDSGNQIFVAHSLFYSNGVTRKEQCWMH